MKLEKVTILRTTAELDEGERVEYQAGPRTTMVVVEAVLDDYVPGDTWVMKVKGYRKQNPRGEWYTGGTFSNSTGLPAPLHDLFRRLRLGEVSQSGTC